MRTEKKSTPNTADDLLQRIVGLKRKIEYELKPILAGKDAMIRDLEAQLVACYSDLDSKDSAKKHSSSQQQPHIPAPESAHPD